MDMPLTEVKARLSEVVERIEAGEAFRITKHGRPVVEMRAVEPSPDAFRARRRAALAMLDELHGMIPAGTKTPEEIKAEYREDLP